MRGAGEKRLDSKRRVGSVRNAGPLGITQRAWELRELALGSPQSVPGEQSRRRGEILRTEGRVTRATASRRPGRMVRDGRRRRKRWSGGTGKEETDKRTEKGRGADPIVSGSAGCSPDSDLRRDVCCYCCFQLLPGPQAGVATGGGKVRENGRTAVGASGFSPGPALFIASTP